MRYGIFSDIHSNREALEAVVAELQKEGIQKFLCAGDLVGYAAEPQACIEQVQQICQGVVAGNHDWAVAGRFSDEWFHMQAREAVRWTAQQLPASSIAYLAQLPLTCQDELVTVAHGTLHHPERFSYLLDADVAAESFWVQKTQVAFVGHTHVPIIFIKDPAGNINMDHCMKIQIKPGYQYLINVGSVGQPRDHQPQASYCIYDSSKKIVELKRVSYIISQTQSKIRQAHLPDFFAQRLVRGM